MSHARQLSLFDRPTPPDPILACDPSVTPEDQSRLSRQCQDILWRLLKGPATNRELAALSLKYTGRVSDLRKAGYVIRCDKLKGGLSVYTLEYSPS